MKTELETIADQLGELRSKQMRLEAKQFESVLTPILNGAVGKTFVYRNNSCGDGEKFDTFRKLLKVAFSPYHAWAIFEQCQITANGTASLTTEVELINQDCRDLPWLQGRGWKPCAIEEYEERRKGTLGELGNPTIRFKDLSK